VVARANLVAWVDSSSTLVVCTSWAEGECASTLSSVSGFIDPFAVALDANNTFYVTDIEAGAVWKVPYAGSLLGSMQSLSTAEEGAKGIAVDASSTFLYWAASTSGVVAKYPIDPDAGTPMALATGLTQPNFVAVDETDVYFTTTSGANGGAVQRCPLPSCEGGPFMVASGRNDPEAIAVDATAVYWVESGQLFKVLK
jgi:sugar lactone lactonase YvrE